MSRVSCLPFWTLKLPFLFLALLWWLKSLGMCQIEISLLFFLISEKLHHEVCSLLRANHGFLCSLEPGPHYTFLLAWYSRSFCLGLPTEARHTLKASNLDSEWFCRSACFSLPRSNELCQALSFSLNLGFFVCYVDQSLSDEHKLNFILFY